MAEPKSASYSEDLKAEGSFGLSPAEALTADAALAASAAAIAELEGHKVEAEAQPDVYGELEEDPQADGASQDAGDVLHAAPLIPPVSASPRRSFARHFSLTPLSTTKEKLRASSKGNPFFWPLVLTVCGVSTWFVRRLLTTRRLKKGPSYSTGKQQKAAAQRGHRGHTNGSIGGQQDSHSSAGGASVDAPPAEPIAPDELQILVAEMALLPAPPSTAATAAPTAPGTTPATSQQASPLTNQHFVVSEDVDIEGFSTTLGLLDGFVSAAEEERPSAHASAQAVRRLIQSGAACVGKSAIQLGDMVGANYGNPYNKAHVSGGGSTGAAVAVATGHATFALATDILGEARVPAAYCGLYCYRGTPGAGGAPGAASSGSGIQALSVMSGDPLVLLKAAEVLGAPGSSNLRGEIIKFVVAEDLFSLCNVEFQPASLAVKRAILKWAGSEQAGAVQLVKFIADSCLSWHQLSSDSPSPHPMLPASLNAFRTAALLLRAEELHSQAERLGYSEVAVPASEQVADVSSVTGPASTNGIDNSAVALSHTAQDTDTGSASHSSQTAGIDTSTSSAAVAPISALGPRPGAQELAIARQVARELFETLRTSVKPDTFMVVPVVPCAAFKRTAGQPQRELFTHVAQALACLPTLAQCPCVTVPLGTVADGTPLSVAIFGVHKSDMRLLGVVQRMAPLIQQAFEGIKQGFLEAAVRQQQQIVAEAEARDAAAAAEAAAAAAAGGKGGKKAAAAAAAAAATAAAAAAAAHANANGSHHNAGSSSNGVTAASSSASSSAGAVHPSHSQPAAPPTPSELRKMERAERHKSKGNELFKVGNFGAAFNEYTRALAENPSNPVYYNNRAMACLKIFRFEQAEDDCNRALQLPVLTPDKVKALLRRATARTALQKYDEAEADLKSVLALEMNNRQARDDLMNLRKMKAEMQAAHRRMLAEYQTAGGGAGGGSRAGLGGLSGVADGGMDLAAAAGNGVPPELARLSPEQIAQYMQEAMSGAGVEQYEEGDS